MPGGGSYAVRPEGYWDVSGYFIDDVSVIPDSVYLSNDEIEFEKAEVNLYPNPNSGEFIIDIEIEEEDRAELLVWNISGQKVAHKTLSNRQINVTLDVANGLYLYVVTVNGERRWTGKVSVGF